MRYYNKEEEKQFSSYLGSAVGSGSESNGDGKNGNTSEHNVNKETENSFIPLISAESKKEECKLNIKVNHKDDLIESIDVECECGNKTKIIIDYSEDNQ